jgi:glycerol kinase
VVLVPAFTGLGAPHWDPDARGAILGLTRGSDRRHLARAVLDAIALQSADLVAAMEADSGRRIPELRVDGGATRSRLLLQVQADLLQRPVVRPANVETTAMGAALLAGIATGLWKASDAKASSRGDVKVKPRLSPADAEARLRRWHEAVAATRAYKPGA